MSGGSFLDALSGGERAPSLQAFDAVVRAADLLVTRELGGGGDGGATAALSHVADALGSGEGARLAVLHCALRDTRLLQSAPAAAAGACLRALVELGGVRAAGVWVERDDGEPECAASEGAHAGDLRDAALAALRGEDPGSGVMAATIGPVGASFGAIAARPDGDAGLRGSEAALAWTATALAPILERRALLAAADERAAAFTETLERRIARLTLDVHDGPLQDVIALLSDVRLFREQLGGALEGVEHGERLKGRIDDFEARLMAVDDDLRALAETFESPSRPDEDLLAVVDEETASLRGRSDLEATLDVEIDPDRLTPSQRIAIARVLREALANVREHSRATAVSVTLRELPGAVRLTVADDGCGFEVGRTMAGARAEGRLGLVGMGERVRLLGGTLDVRSAHGEGTTVTVVLPEWRPAGQQG